MLRRSVLTAFIASMAISTGCKESSPDDDPTSEVEQTAGQVTPSPTPAEGSTQTNPSISPTPAPPEPQEPTPTPTPEPSDPYLDCTGKSLSFSHDFLDEEHHDNFSYATGIGGINPPSHTIPVGHTYLSSIKDTTIRMPVYLPTEARLHQVMVSDYGDGKLGIGLFFYICRGISFHFGHVNELAPEIEAIANCGNAECRWEAPNESPVLLAAGTLIGYKGGPHYDNAGLDFGVIDVTKEPESVPGGSDVWGTYVYSACPYDYFADESVRDAYRDLMNAVVQVEPLCGTLSYDVQDTARGYWFSPDHERSLGPDIEKHHLVLIPVNTNRDREAISTGALMAAGAYYDFEESGLQNRRTTDVTADGNKYCYGPLFSHGNTNDPLPGFVILTMPTNTTLSAEYVDSGNCPADPNEFDFSANAKQFAR